MQVSIYTHQNFIGGPVGAELLTGAPIPLVSVN